MKKYVISFLSTLPAIFQGLTCIFFFWNMFEFRELVFLWIPSVVTTIILWSDIQKYEEYLTKTFQNNEKDSEGTR